MGNTPRRTLDIDHSGVLTAVYSPGYRVLGDHPGRGHPDQEFPGHAVTGPELRGPAGAHVAAADPCRGRADLAEVVADQRRALHDDEGVRRGGIVHRHRHPTIPAQATTFNRICISGEDKLKVPRPAVQHEPDRLNVGAAVWPGRTDMSRPCPRTQEVPDLLHAHVWHRGLSSELGRRSTPSRRYSTRPGSAISGNGSSASCLASSAAVEWKTTISRIPAERISSWRVTIERR